MIHVQIYDNLVWWDPYFPVLHDRPDTQSLDKSIRTVDGLSARQVTLTLITGPPAEVLVVGTNAPAISVRSQSAR